MFRGCSALDKVTLGENIQTIGDYAFANSGIRTINIPAKVSAIPNYCFDSASRLATMSLPNTVTSIGAYAYAASGLQTLIIPSSVKTVSDHTFYNCKSLKSITLQDGVRTIEQYAFAGSNLPSLSVPKSVTSIANAVFNACSNFKTLHIDDGSTAISMGVHSTDKGLFYDCPLKSVYIGRNATYLGATDKSYSPYFGNKSLMEVELGDCRTEVYHYEFAECTGLKQVVLGDAVNRISERGFYRCTGLETFEIGASVQDIGDEVFSDCTSLYSLKTWAMTPPFCGQNALNDINRQICTLYIPYGTEGEYASADQWNTFFYIDLNSATL